MPVALLYNVIFLVHLYFSSHQASDSVIQRLSEQSAYHANQIDMLLKHFLAVTDSKVRKLMGHGKFMLEDDWLIGLMEENSYFENISFLYISGYDEAQLKYTHRDTNNIKLDEKKITISSELYFNILLITNKLASKDGSENHGFYPARFVNDSWMVPYIFSVFKQGQCIGFFVVNINMSKIRKDFISKGVSQPKFSMINNNGGYIYTDSETANRFKYKNILDTVSVYGVPDLWNDIENEIERGTSFFKKIWIPMRNHEYWFFCAPIKTGSWLLITHIRKEDAMSSATGRVGIDTFIMGICLFLTVICALFVSHRITNPLTQLKVDMDEADFIGKNRVINVSTNDEIGSLAISFRKLLEKIRERDIALNDARVNNIGRLVQKLGGTFFYFSMNAEGDISYVSGSVGWVLGYRASEFKTSFYDLIIKSEECAFFEEQLHYILTVDSAEKFEVDLLHKNGSIKRVEIFWCGIEGVNNEGVVIEGLANDITDRTNDAEKFKSLLNSSPDATIITNTDGVISLINSKAEQLFGYSRENLQNMPLGVLSPLSSRVNNPLMGGLMAATWDQLCLSEYETQGVDINGRTFPIEITSNPLETSEGLLISIVVRDITCRKQIEHELRTAKEQAEKASKAKGMFLSNMSHELRTPLNGVLGYTQILLRENSMPLKHQRCLKAIESSGHHLLSVINDILDLTKIESGGIELHKHPCDLRQLVNDVKAIVLQKAVNKGLKVNLDFPAILSGVLILDEIKVRQVLLNLMSNAVKYTQEGEVNLSVIIHEKSILFSVADSGVGISDKNLTKIFEPFKKLNPGLETGGTGLGLAISRWLVFCMEGELKVKSQQGVGSTFFFSLPLEFAKQGVTLKNKRTLSGYGNINVKGAKDAPLILVVDDIESNRDMMAGLLTGAGFRVEIACNGLEAINAVDSGCYDLVLMDIKMPVLNGFEAVKKIRTMGDVKKLPIIAVTASVSIETRKKLLKEGFNGYVGKPFDADNLFQLVGQLLELPLPNQKALEINEVSILIGNLKVQAKDVLLNILSESLDLGDLELLENRAMAFAAEPELKPVAELIVGLCHNMDIEGLEQVMSRIKSA